MLISELLNVLKQLKINIKQNFQGIREVLELKEKEIIRNAELMISKQYQILDSEQQKTASLLQNLQLINNNLQSTKNSYSYNNYILKKKNFDQIMNQTAKQEPPQNITIQTDFTVFHKLLKDLVNLKTKITNIKTFNFQGSFNIAHFINSQYQICDKVQNKKHLLQRATIDTFKDQPVKYSQQSTSLFQSHDIYIKNSKGESQSINKNRKDPSWANPNSNKIFQQQKSVFNNNIKSGLQGILHINSHKQNFNSAKRLKSRSNTSKKMQQVRQMLKNPFKK